MRHGPHQAAHQSTRTMPSLLMVSRKVSAVRSTVVMWFLLSRGEYPYGYVSAGRWSGIPGSAAGAPGRRLDAGQGLLDVLAAAGPGDLAAGGATDGTAHGGSPSVCGGQTVTGWATASGRRAVRVSQPPDRLRASMPSPRRMRVAR